MEAVDLVGHAVSATGGGVTVAVVVKLVVRNWLKRHDKLETSVGKLSDALIRIEEQLKGLVHANERVYALERETAVYEERIKNVQRDINNLGHKVRANGNGGGSCSSK